MKTINLRSSILLLGIVLFFSQCAAIYEGMPKGGNSGNSGWLALLGLSGNTQQVNASSSPTVGDPGKPLLQMGNMTIPSDAVIVAPAKDQSITQNTSFTNLGAVPVGKVYEITLKVDMSGSGIQTPDSSSGGYVGVQFPSPVTIQYDYDKSKLKEAGLSEELHVFYYDEMHKQWVSLQSTQVDSDKSQVTATTMHFTKFVLAALPDIPGTQVAAAPSCVSSSLTLGGTAQSGLMTLGDHFQYYLDRNYYVLGQQGDFASLGFDQALGIATCMGGDSTCGSMQNGKYNKQPNYIQFTAPKDMDVYVMYDPRGGSTPDDISKDPLWLTQNFTFLTGKRIYTTDVGMGSIGYKVYKKSFTQGQQVTLGGNYYQIGNHRVASNYWVALLPSGNSAGIGADWLCQNPDTTIPALVSGLLAIPGSDQVTLQWINPNPAPDHLLIRSGTVAPPQSPVDGNPISVSSSDPSNPVDNHEDTGLTQGIKYNYSVFSMNKDNLYQSHVSVSTITGTDTDGDGIADYYETYFDYRRLYPSTPAPYFTDPNNTDTDGDGISDLDEIIQHTDPTNGDAQKPQITAFTLTGSSPTENPYIGLNLQATDNGTIQYYLISEDATPPTFYDSRWTTAKPTVYQLHTAGTYTLYAWVMDTAGNISPAYQDVAVNLTGIKVPKFAYILSDTSSGKMVTVHTINPTTGALSVNPIQTLPAGKKFRLGPLGKFAFALGGSDFLSILVYKVDTSTGMLTYVGSYREPHQPTTYQLPNGQYYDPNPSAGTDFTITPDGSQLILLAQSALDGSGNFSDMSQALVFQINATTGEVTFLDYSTLISQSSTTAVGYGNRILMDPSGQAFYVEVSARRNDGASYSSLWSYPSNIAANTTVIQTIHAIHPMSADSNSTFILIGGSSVNPADFDGNGILSIDPSGSRVIYSTKYTGNDLCSDTIDSGFGLGLTQCSGSTNGWAQHSGHGYFHPNGNNFYTVASGGSLPTQSITVLSVDPQGHFSISHSLPTAKADLYMDDLGRSLYSYFGSGQSGGNNTIDVYGLSRGSTPDQPVFQESVSLNLPGNMSEIADNFSTHQANDPPVVRAVPIYAKNVGSYSQRSQVYYNIYHYETLHPTETADWIRVGHQAQIITVNSFDPDRYRCQANTQNYHWTAIFQSIPAVSKLKNSDLKVLSGDFPFIQFTPDAPGEYKVQIGFTDDPGICPASAKTSYGSVTMKAGYPHQENAYLKYVAGTPQFPTTLIDGTTVVAEPVQPGGNAVWWEAPEVTGHSSGWRVCDGLFNLHCYTYGAYNFDSYITTESTNYYKLTQVEALCGPDSCAWLRRMCNSPALPNHDALAWCAKNGTPGILFRLNFWTFDHKEQTQLHPGLWLWWDYNP